MATTFDRRSFMGYFAGAGLSSTLFPGVLWAKLAAGAEITVDTIASAEEVAGLHFDPAERELMLDGPKQQEQRIEAHVGEPAHAGADIEHVRELDVTRARYGVDALQPPHIALGCRDEHNLDRITRHAALPTCEPFRPSSVSGCRLARSILLSLRLVGHHRR
mgnify:CR=1 FL=1